MPKITVLVAVYNAAPYLPTCLDSLLGQTLRDIEIIAADDASTDGSLDVLRSYAARDPRLHVLHRTENGGAARARNDALAAAGGTLTCMVDADDYLAEDALEQIWHTFTTTPAADAVLFRCVAVDETGGEREHVLPAGRTTFDGREACLLSIRWQLHGLAAVRTTLHKRMPYDATCRVYSDDNTARLHYLACRQVAVSGGTYFYRQHAASTTHRHSLQRLDFPTANDALRRSLEAAGADADILCACEDYCLRIFAGVYRDYHAARADFTPAERAEARRRLARSYAALRPARLPWRTLLHPTLGYLPGFALYRLRHAVVQTVKRWLRRGV